MSKTVQKPFAETVKELREIELYFVIEQLGGLQWRIRHDSYRNSARGLINQSQIDADDKALVELGERLETAVEQTKRFGVEEPFNENRGGSETYFKWYRWWDAYAKGLSDEEFRAVDAAMFAKEDISSYRPQGDWRT